MRRVLLLALVLVVVVVGLVRERQDHSEDGSSRSVAVSSAEGPSSSPAAPETAPAEPSPASSPPATESPSSLLQGTALARAWLIAFLSRPERDDPGWASAIAPITTPELVTNLRTAGPDLVGLDQLSSWRVIKVEPYDPVDPAVDTESRQVLAYAATVTDGTHTAEKPFELYAYLQPDGRWLVGDVEQPYSSEG